jgi:hypothetical protein
LSLNSIHGRGKRLFSPQKLHTRSGVLYPVGYFRGSNEAGAKSEVTSGWNDKQALWLLHFGMIVYNKIKILRR